MKRSGWKSEHGNVIVEFAIVLPIFLLIVWGVVDFARAFYTSNSLATAVREGARFAAVKDWPSGTTTAAVTTRRISTDSAKMRVRTAFNAFGGAVVDTSKVVVTPPGADGLVTVEVTGYDWFTTTPLKLITGGKITMKKKAVFRWERQTTF
jgi:Flp pilus assembly protein TadG